jgi:hypothetical protein
MKKIISLLFLFFFISGCMRIPDNDGNLTKNANFPVQTFTPYPTYTLYPTYTPFRAFTPTPKPTSTDTSILFYDDFSNIDWTSEYWEISDTKWKIENNQLIFTQEGRAFAGDTNWTDYIYSINFMGKETIDRCVFFRYTDYWHSYYIFIRSSPINDIVLARTTPDKPDYILATQSFNNYSSNWYSLKIKLQNNHIQVLVNDELKIDYIDKDSPLLSGKIGINAYLPDNPLSVAYFDNAMVKILDENLISPTLTPTPKLSSQIPSKSTAQSPSENSTDQFPSISIDDLYSSPESYYLKSFMINGKLVAFGYIPFNGNNQFVLQVGVGNYIRPIIVLNFSPNDNLRVNNSITVWGYGYGSINDGTNYAPLIIGVGWQTSGAEGQWKAPPNSWIPIH